MQKNIKTTDEELKDIKYALDQSAIVAITDEKGTILHVNELFVKISQYSEAELLGQNHRIINSGYHSTEFFNEMWKTIYSGNKWRGEICNRRKDGSLYWVDTTIVPLLDSENKPCQFVSIRSDVTKQKQMEKEVKKSNELYKLIANNSSDFIAVVSRKGNFQYISPSFNKVLGYDLQQIASGSLYSLIVDEDVSEVTRHVKYVDLLGNSSISVEFRIRNAREELVYIETTINSIRDEGDYFGYIVFVMRDITGRKKADRRIEDLADYDQLTKIPNRLTFRKKIQLEVGDAVRNDSTIALVFMNVDRLRYVNDSFGHEAGDYVLSVIANRLKVILPEKDVVSRVSGDEFAFILKNLKDTEHGGKIAIEILRYLEEPISISGHPYILSNSMGIAVCPDHSKNATELSMMAEKALYNIKATGGGSYEMYRSGTVQKTLERILLERELRKSIQQEHFELEYQPKFNLAYEELTGVEALVRWNHPDLGRITPDRFIPIAEETRMIIELGEWIFRAACLQAKKWEEAGYVKYLVGINMSIVQLEEPTIVSTIKDVLTETGISPEYIEIEVTESAFSERDDIKEHIIEIRKLGIKVSIDDFGTGYSTFSYIKELPADILKIDMAFIRDIHTNSKSRAIVKAIISLANTVNLKVIAEGIEYEEQVDILLEDGCLFGQGYYYSKPIIPEACERFMKKIN